MRERDTRGRERDARGRERGRGGGARERAEQQRGDVGALFLSKWLDISDSILLSSHRKLAVLAIASMLALDASLLEHLPEALSFCVSVLVELLALQIVEAARGRELKNLLLFRCEWGYGCRLRSLLRGHLLMLTGSSGGRGRQDSGGLCAAGQHRSDRAAGESAPQTQGDTSS